MIKFPRLIWRSLRFQLISWYVLLLVLTLAVFSIYIFFQFRNLEQNQQDTTLQAGFTAIRPMVDGGSPVPYFRRFPGGNGVPPGSPGGPGPSPDLLRNNIQGRLITPEGKVADSQGNIVAEMPAYLPTQPGFATVSSTENGQWRILSQPIIREGITTGWLQVGQPYFELNTEVSRLFTPIGLGTLIAMLLAVLGGLFLANQALRPIDRVTRTAQAISTQELSRRINYDGPDDEIGQLAKTLDQMLERLEKGFEQERRFTSDASHELRTPLTALKGRIEVTLSRVRNPGEYQETLAILNTEVDRLIRLSNSLLYLARLDQNKQEGQFEALNLSDLLDSMLDTMEPIAELKSITLAGEIAPGVQIPGNLDQLTRLFLNLLDNALKYNPAGGEVTLRLEKTEKNAVVSVIDTGPGISSRHLPHLFERFYRAQEDRASKSGGAGLGLAIAYEIARQHGGKLEVESKPGKGTTFQVLLPLQEVPRPLPLKQPV